MDARKDNLIPFDCRTVEEQRKIARKGGVASGKARRKKRTMAEAAKLILSLPVTDADQIAELKEIGIEEKDRTFMVLLVTVMIKKAIAGNLKAAELIRDTIGENPQYRIYEKRLNLLVDNAEKASSIVDEWVAAVEASGE